MTLLALFHDDAAHASPKIAERSAAEECGCNVRGLGQRCGAMGYEEFAARLIEHGIITDPWLEGQPRFASAPLILERAELAELAEVAEELAEAFDELTWRAREDESWLDFLALTPWQRAMFEMGGEAWHGLARADLFRTDDGWVTTELNCDTPTGEAEAVVLGALCTHAGCMDLDGGARAIDVNRNLGAAFLAMNERYLQELTAAGAPRTVGIVYPTEFVEDLALVRLYRGWFERAGFEVVLGSPFNLEIDEHDRVSLFGTPITLLWRHYKTDWWGERECAFDDEGFEDVSPLERELTLIARAERARTLVVVNPMSAVVPQNKRAMALFWERLPRFSTRTQRIVRATIPPTFRLETRDRAQLLADKDQWVLKSDYGAEGDEVIVGKLVSPELFEASLAHARPGRWVVQRRFDPVERAGKVVNYGVYLCAGRTCGVYARMHPADQITGESALSVPVLVRA